MRIIKSFGYAFRGLAAALREESNLRIHLLALTMVVSLGFYFDIKTWEWCILIFVISLVFSMELINSALENLTDLVSREQNPVAGKVKDIAASAVLVAAAGSIIIASLIFGKYLFTP